MLVQEEYFTVGTNVKAIPKEEPDAGYCPGVIIHIKELSNHMEYFVRFNLPKDQRLSDWYRFEEMEFVASVSATFKQPKIHEVRNIEHIEMGEYAIRTWYFSPYPRPFNQLDKMYICPRCLRYARNQEVYHNHLE